MNSECKSYVKCVTKAGNSGRVRVKKLSGYNVFCMESRVGMEGTPKEIMTRLGGMWKDSKKKEFYNKKAGTKNEQAVADFQEVPEDSQVSELKARVEDTIKQFKKDLKKASKLAAAEDAIENAVEEAKEAADAVENAVEEAREAADAVEAAVEAVQEVLSSSKPKRAKKVKEVV